MSPPFFFIHEIFIRLTQILRDNPYKIPFQKVNHSLHASSSVLSFPLKIYFIYESKTTRLHSTSAKCFLQPSNLLSRLHQRLCSPTAYWGAFTPQLLVVNQKGEGRTTKCSQTICCAISGRNHFVIRNMGYGRQMR